MNTENVRNEFPKVRQKTLWMIFAALILLRLFTLGLAPIYDPSEGRYAGIANAMLESGDWVTPRLDPATPFWGKPPLHFWMTAVSLKVLGNNAFAARLPAFFSALVVLALTGLVAWKHYGRSQAFWALLMLLSTGLFFIGSAYVVTDMTLTLCTTGALTAFFMVDHASGRRASLLWKYAFFFFLGLGMLAKGPVALVLSGAPIVLWTLITRRWEKVRDFPWFSGTLLALLVCAPWYALAEHHTPGFLNYFFIHEHVLRYLKKDYGDLYSNGHAFPYGTIWGLAALGLMPWTPLFLWSLGQAIRQKVWKRLSLLETEVFLICWALVPMLFFTVSRNVVVTYALPGFPALAILGSRLLQRFAVGDREAVATSPAQERRTSLLMTVFSCILLIVAMGGIYYVEMKHNLPVYEMLIGGALAGAGILYLVAMHRRRNRLYQTLCMACLIPCFTAYFCVFVSTDVGYGRSTRDLVEQIKQDPQYSQYKIKFFDTTPYSADFYLSEPLTSLNEDKSLLKNPLGDREILIIKKRDFKRVKPEWTSHLRKVMTHGPYDIYVSAEEK